MHKADRLVYLDSNVIIAFLGQEPERYATIVDFFEETIASKGATQILTSVIALAEVSFLTEERDPKSFQPDTARIIEDFWRDESLLSIVELNQEIAIAAQRVQRLARSEARKPMKPMDALHLATAKWVGAHEFFTYNRKDFQKFDTWAQLKVLEPYVNQPRLGV